MDQDLRAARPLRRDAELNRQRITAAAREVFAERGLEVTLDDIAHRAGLGVGTVYRRFPNKEALIDALFEETFQHIVDVLEEAVDGPDPWEGLLAWVTDLVSLQARDLGLRDVMLSAGYGRDRVAELRDRIKPLLESLVERAQAQGRLREDVRPADIPMVQLMIAAAAEFARHAADPETWRRYIVILFDGLCVRRDHPTPLPVEVISDEDVEEAMRNWPPGRHG